jgi:DNA-binding CsgD family transcriptional regulator
MRAAAGTSRAPGLAGNGRAHAAPTPVRPQPVRRDIRVAVVEEQEIYQRGLVASLAEDPSLEPSVADAQAVDDGDVDIAVVSSDVARRHRFPCPVVVCGEGPDGPACAAVGNDVVGMVQRRSLTVAQLHATVHAAAAGLRVNADLTGDGAREELDPRSLDLLRLMADGASTREMADHMCYSERTIKKIITGLEVRLQARSRAHIVALAIRQGLI